MGDTRLLIVAGKGGVGKTTVAAVAAEWARRAGKRVCLVDVEGRPGLGAFFGHPEACGYEPVELAPRLSVRTIAPDQALVEYLDDHGLKRFSKRLVESGALEVIATGAPGLRDILVLGKIKQLALGDAYDLVVLDSPASGHAISFLLSARGMLDAVRGGPVRAQAEDVLTLLADQRRCQVLLVALPEETPINETLETEAALRTKIEVAVAGVVVNQVLDGADLQHLSLGSARLPAAEREALEAAAEYTTRRVNGQAEQIARLEAMSDARLSSVVADAATPVPASGPPPGPPVITVLSLPALPEPALDALVDAFSRGVKFSGGEPAGPNKHPGVAS